MTVSDMASSVAALTGALAWVSSCITTWKLRRVTARLEEVRIATDGLVTKLLSEGKAASFLQGQQAGRDERKL